MCDCTGDEIVGTRKLGLTMCECNGVEMGTYANSVALYPPSELGLTRVPVTVDRCVADEIIDLWNRGIVTTGNCCGHNKLPGFVSVKPDFIPQMKALGYRVYPNPFRPGDEDQFYAKSVPWLESVMLVKANGSQHVGHEAENAVEDYCNARDLEWDV